MNVQSHPEDGSSMPLEEMRRQLALTGNPKAYYELDDALGTVYNVETARMTEEAWLAICDVAYDGGDESVFDLAGFDKKRSSAQRVLDDDMLKPSAYTGKVAEAAKSMTPGQRLYLRRQAVRYALLKMDIEHPDI